MTDPQPSASDLPSYEFYNTHARQFIDGTLHLDIRSVYAPFFQLIQPGAHILDAGCGSGRDALVFLERGYRVTAIDASSEMVKHAAQLTGLAVKQVRFEDLDYFEEFDAIWANASLLHVPAAGIDAVLERLIRALRADGILYVSFKFGEREEIINERLFSYYSERTFRALIEKHPALKVLSVAGSDDNRPGHKGEKWLNGLLRKKR